MPSIQARAKGYADGVDQSLGFEQWATADELTDIPAEIPKQMGRPSALRTAASGAREATAGGA